MHFRHWLLVVIDLKNRGKTVFTLLLMFVALDLARRHCSHHFNRSALRIDRGLVQGEIAWGRKSYFVILEDGQLLGLRLALHAAASTWSHFIIYL